MFRVENRASVFACPSSFVSKLSIFGLRIRILVSGTAGKRAGNSSAGRPTGA